MSERRVKSITYHDAEQGYFEKRGLKRYAGVWSLWALGVGAVISGDFSGWNLGVGQAGFGGFLVAAKSIVEMAARTAETAGQGPVWVPARWPGGLGVRLGFDRSIGRSSAEAHQRLKKL